MTKFSLPIDEFRGYVARLIHHHLPDETAPAAIDPAVFRRALDRAEHCFKHVQRKYYCADGQTLFDHLNGDHMAAFLYFLGNTVWRETGNEALAARLFYLNKIMHGLDLFYSVAMPDIFLLVHPLGTVLGNAKYSDFLVVYQNCTVGALTDTYPQFGAGTILYARSTVLGDCRCGADVVFAANSFIVDTDVPDRSVVLGQYPNHKLSPNHTPVRARCFDPIAREDNPST